jgi:hypothetical protein
MKAKLEVDDNLVDNFMVFNERDDLHLASTGGAKQRVHFIEFSYHLCPALLWDKRLLLFYVEERVCY